MPPIDVVLYRDSDGSVPFLEWFERLTEKAQDKCRVRIQRLRALSYELRRPEADLLKDGVYELRIGLQGINYRILYFYHGNQTAVISHGLTKERLVSSKEIDLAVRRKARFDASPATHTHVEG